MPIFWFHVVVAAALLWMLLAFPLLTVEAEAGTTIVLLIPARTDTAYFHDYIYQKPNVEIRFVRGRLKFGDGNNSAPFPSMVVVFRPPEL